MYFYYTLINIVNNSLFIMIADEIDVIGGIDENDIIKGNTFILYVTEK